MKKGMVCAALVAFGLMGPSLGPHPISPVSASDYTVQEDTSSNAASNSVNLGGVVTQVDSDRDRVTFNADDGRHYTLDTSRSDIDLPGTARPGETMDLTRGMRLRVDGTRLSSNIIQADRIRVVGNSGVPDRPAPPSDTADATDGIDLCGTVKSVNQRDGSFIVHINDHTRTILVDDHTDLTGASGDTNDRVPVRAGVRVIVSGILRSNGTVVADTVRLVSSDAGGRRDTGVTRELVGRVIQQSEPDTSQDIKIQISPDREMTIRTTPNISITRDGQTISLYDLTTDDVVRVSGSPDGDAFRADRITVVRTDVSGN